MSQLTEFTITAGYGNELIGTKRIICVGGSYISYEIYYLRKLHWAEGEFERYNERVREIHQRLSAKGLLRG